MASPRPAATSPQTRPQASPRRATSFTATNNSSDTIQYESNRPTRTTKPSLDNPLKRRQSSYNETPAESTRHKTKRKTLLPSARAADPNNLIDAVTQSLANGTYFRRTSNSHSFQQNSFDENANSPPHPQARLERTHSLINLVTEPPAKPLPKTPTPPLLPLKFVNRILARNLMEVLRPFTQLGALLELKGHFPVAFTIKNAGPHSALSTLVPLRTIRGQIFGLLVCRDVVPALKKVISDAIVAAANSTGCAEISSSGEAWRFIEHRHPFGVVLHWERSRQGMSEEDWMEAIECRVKVAVCGWLMEVMDVLRKLEEGGAEGKRNWM